MTNLRPVLKDQWALYRLYQKQGMEDWVDTIRETIRRLIKVIRELDKQP